MFLEDSRKSENDMKKKDEKRRVIGMLQIFAARFGMLASRLPFTYITHLHEKKYHIHA